MGVYCNYPFFFFLLGIVFFIFIFNVTLSMNFEIFSYKLLIFQILLSIMKNAEALKRDVSFNASS